MVVPKTTTSVIRHPNIVTGLLRKAHIPNVKSRNKILINDNVGFEDKSLDVFMNAAKEINIPITEFVLPNTKPNTTMKKNMEQSI